MRVQVGDEHYGVYFEYEPAEFLVRAFEHDLRKVYPDEDTVQEFLSDIEFDGDAPRDVFCAIDRLIPGPDGQFVTADEIAEDRAQVSKHDKYDKLVGRKLAFSRAVNQIQDRALRTALWTAFLSSHYIRTGDGAKRKVVQ